MGLQWRKGQKEQPGNIDPMIARAFSDPLSIPPEFLTWLKARLELEPPDFIAPDLPATGGGTGVQKVIEHNESDIGSETDLDFADGSLTNVRRPVFWTVTNTPGVRDVIEGRIESRFVNPGDIEIDPLLAEIIELNAGSADFTITDTSLTPIYDPTYIPVGRVANFHAGFGLQVAAQYSNIVYADNCRVAAYIDDNSGASSPSGLNTSTWDLPGVGSYAGVFSAGWQTNTEPTMSHAETDYVFIRAGGEPYLDVFPSTFTGTVYWRWVYMPGGAADAAYVTDVPMPYPDDPSVANIVQFNPTTGQWENVTEVDVVGRVGVRVNSGGSEYQRQRINVIEGTGIDLSHADDSVNEEVDLTVTVDPSELSVTGLSFPGGDTFLRADGTFTDHKDRLVAVFAGTPVVGGAYPVVIPRGNDDADISIDLERLALRLEAPSTSGSVVAILQKATGGGAPVWSDVATITVAASAYEGTEQTIGSYTITSGDLLRLYFTSIGTGADWYTGTVTGTEV